MFWLSLDPVLAYRSLDSFRSLLDLNADAIFLYSLLSAYGGAFAVEAGE